MEKNNIGIKECGTVALLGIVAAAVTALAEAPKAGATIKQIVDNIQGRK